LFQHFQFLHRVEPVHPSARFLDCAGNAATKVPEKWLQVDRALLVEVLLISNGPEVSWSDAS
jgi:hypothetical protein